MTPVARIAISCSMALLFSSHAAFADHTITPWRHNCPAAVSVTFDDGLLSQVTNAVPILNAKNVKATFFVPTASDGQEVTWEQWRQLAAQGHEIASHGVNHVELTKLSESQLRYELGESQRTINQNVPSQICVSLAYPLAVTNAFVQSVTSEYYVAARVGWSPEGGDYNFYEQVGDYKPVNFMDVGSESVYDATTMADIDSHLNTAVQHNAWYSVYLHSVNQSDESFFSTMLDHIVAKRVWAATFGDAARYMRERMASTIRVVSEDGSAIQLDLANSLDRTVYTIPLTIRSTVPATWLKVNVQQGSTSVNVDSVTEGAETVVYFDAAPNGGAIVLTPSEGPEPDFTLVVTPSSQPVAPGGSIDYAITINPRNGFGGAVTLSVAGLPAGATASFAPNPTSAASTLTVATSLASPTSNYSLIITGVSGAITRTATVTLALFEPDFSIAATPASQTVAPGGRSSYGLTVVPTGGFGDTVALSVTGLPAGASGTFSPNPATASSSLMVATAGDTPTGTFTLTITGVAGTLTHATTVSLVVVSTPPPGTAVAVDAVGPDSGGASIASGSGVSWNHTVTSTDANLLLTVGVAVGKSPDTGTTLAVTFNGVAMTSAGLVHSNNQASGYVQLFYLVAPPPGTHTVQVTLNGGTASIEAGSVSFTGVNQATPVRHVATNYGSGTAPSVTIASDPLNMVVDAMATGCNGTITSTTTLRWLNEVNCTTAGGNGAQSTAAGAVSVAMRYTVPSDWWGIIGMDIVAAGAVQTFDFALSNGGDRSVAPGNTVTNTVVAQLSSGTPQAVTFSAAGLPAGVSVTFDPANCSPTCTATMSIVADSAAAVGTWPIVVTATDGLVSHATAFTLTVAAPPPPDFSISGTPSSRTVPQGGSTSYAVTIAQTNGFSGDVLLSVAGLPAGATAAFAPNPTPGSSTLSVATAASTSAGVYPLTITGVSGSLTHTTTVSLTVSAGIVVTSPNTAVTWKATSKQNITFTHTLGIGESVNIEVSRDSGATWTLIAVFTTTSATSGSYPWTVSGPATTHARIRVSSAANRSISDISDVDFTISNPTITVTAPNTGVSWRAGDTKNITFSHTLAVGQPVNIEVSRDGGVTWGLVAGITTTSATSGTYAWLVTGPATRQARIRISWAVDPIVADMSDVNFTILPRTTVTAPNTAVTWGAGSTRDVTWTHNLGAGGLVDIDFSPDAGVTWAPLAQGIASSTATTGSYTAPMPSIVTGQALIRVSPSGDPSGGDASDVPFTIATPAVTVTTPNTAVKWSIGSTQTIRWTHNLGTRESVRIDLARDGASFTETIATSAVDTGNTAGTFSWTVTGPATTTARIRVTWIRGETVTDRSNVNFTIR